MLDLNPHLRLWLCWPNQEKSLKNTSFDVVRSTGISDLSLNDVRPFNLHGINCSSMYKEVCDFFNIQRQEKYVFLICFQVGYLIASGWLFDACSNSMAYISPKSLFHSRVCGIGM